MFQDHGELSGARPRRGISRLPSSSSVHSYESATFTIDLGPALIIDAGQHVATKFFLPLRPCLGMEGNEAQLPCGVAKCSSMPGTPELLLKVWFSAAMLGPDVRTSRQAEKQLAHGWVLWPRAL